MTPAPDDLWFLPLGGTGEIGMNLNLYGHDGRWLMVDCGITFARPGETGPHVQMPDPTFISERRKTLEALIVTHAHEDHVGAVAHLWPRLQ
ncbi:MAG: MBL fold metallo-hydrolase, partial [Xanthomonadales bacterium]|nr:MBL fold metallo-hydrolase [Xanthomonadales bacterium]